MRPTIVLSFALLSTVAELRRPGNPAAGALRDLNECIQQRFLDTRALGMMRILPVHGLRQFRPENPKEQAMVQQLQQQGYEVALYLPGRGVLAQSPTTATFPLEFPNPRRGLQGPAFITSLANPDDLPKPAALLADARVALASFDAGQGYDLQKDGWTLAMRPLRATSEVCVRCHTTGAGGANDHLGVGDALGVVLYLSRQVSQ
jgi:hypothetical protein